MSNKGTEINVISRLKVVIYMDLVGFNICIVVVLLKTTSLSA